MAFNLSHLGVGGIIINILSLIESRDSIFFKTDIISLVKHSEKKNVVLFLSLAMRQKDDFF